MSRDELPVCTACATQHLTADGTTPTNCKICDDPRQFVPPEGQSWTTLGALKQKHKNEIKQDSVDSRIWTIRSEPQIGIGQRCFLLETPHGNVMWDIICLLDDETIKFIKSKGGLKAIVISHPHYYTTHAEWANAFDCPVYIADDDKEWLCRAPPSPAAHSLISGPSGATVEILPGVTVIKAGGHFPGSLLLHWEKALFIADTIVTVPSAYSPYPRPPGQTSYVFQWSIVNSIPLPPWEISKIWNAVKPLGFETTHGAFRGMDIRDKNVKARMLESMKIQIRAEGHDTHELLSERLL